MPSMMFVGFAIWGVILGGSSYFALRFVRAFEQRRTTDSELSTLRERVTELEEAMESLRGDVERLEDGQEFTTRLLAPRTERRDDISERRHD